MSKQAKCRFVVLTGGPGAGKTAVMEAARQIFHKEIAVLPEAASIVYSGGFPRHPDAEGVMAAQRAIFHVQTELERYVVRTGNVQIALCDRGVSDCAAYWPGGQLDFYRALGTTRDEVFSRYSAVIHLRTPSAEFGYDHSNPMRIETPEQAALLDARIERIWDGHPNRYIVPATRQFTDKVEQVTSLIRATMSEPIPETFSLPSTVLLQ